MLLILSDHRLKLRTTVFQSLMPTLPSWVMCSLKKKNAETKFTDSFTCSKFTFLKVTFPGVAGTPDLELVSHLTQPRPCLATSGSNFLCISGTHVIGYSRLFQESNASVKVCGLVFHYSLVIALRFPTQLRQTFVFLTGLYRINFPFLKLFTHFHMCVEARGQHEYLSWGGGTLFFETCYLAAMIGTTATLDFFSLVLGITKFRSSAGPCPG